MTQSTSIIQRPGLTRVYQKHMYRGNVVLAEHLVLTMCEFHTTVPDRHLDRAMSLWRDPVFAALGIIAAVLDDRIAHTEVFEDVLIDFGRHDQRSWTGPCAYGSMPPLASSPMPNELRLHVSLAPS